MPIWSYAPYTNNINEWWLTPPVTSKYPGDHACFQIDFNMGPNEWFWQEGTPQNPKVYWLTVQAQLPNGGPTNLFGWKTCPTNWNDAAVWAASANPMIGPWNKLVYPPAHSRAGQPIGLSFRLTGQQTSTEIKWSQPPVTATNEVNLFNGWNEMDLYGGSRIIADDWVCTTTNPVTDIHWWGSFLNWNSSTPPQLPDAFFITFWTDVAAGMDPQNPFSHPGLCLQLDVCTNFSCQFVGWDWDPRAPALMPESCFRFDVDLVTNDWFHQNPLTGTNIYWLGISAVYNSPQGVDYPWGWKTRPRDPASTAPDAAARIFNPTAPGPGSPFILGQPIQWPDTNGWWDMAFVLTTRATEDQDFGDAPAPYPTLLTNNGARHFILPGFHLGSLIDAETNGLPNWNATGDDTNNLADEDGVLFVAPVLVATQAWANVTLASPSGTGQLDAWLDFDHSGSWETSEKIFNNVTLASGTNSLSFSIPTNALVGPTFARFRLSSAGGLLPTGAAADGEVEDYMVTLKQFTPMTNIVITNIVVTPTNCTVYWKSETNVHYWLLGTTNLSINVTNWSQIGSEVIGPANRQVETNRWPASRFYRVVAPYTWP